MYISKYFLSCIALITVLAICANAAITSNSIKTNNPELKTNRLSETSINLIESLRKQIRVKENELHKAEVINKNFERLVQLVNILGQVDTFLTEKTKILIKKLAALAKEEKYNIEDSNES